MQAARDTQPLRLLRSERPPPTRATLDLEPAEHLVERANESGHLGAARLGQTLAGTQQIDRPHPADKTLERREDRPEQEKVQRKHQAERNHEIGHLDESDRGVDRHGSQSEQQRGRRQQRRVDDEDPPEQR